LADGSHAPTISTPSPALITVAPVANPPPAPSIVADGVTATGMHGGQFFATFEIVVFNQALDKVLRGRRQPVLHLRIPVSGLVELRDALNDAVKRAEFVVTPAQGPKQ
jgi:hypothetical protein